MLDYPSGHTPSDRPYEPSAMSDPGFVLKTTPPRMPRAALVRERLVREAEGMFGATAVSVSAPAGFGKTTLLLQWRQRWLEQGARVAWFGADPQDDPARFTVGLWQAVRNLGLRLWDETSQRLVSWRQMRKLRKARTRAEQRDDERPPS